MGGQEGSMDQPSPAGPAQPLQPEYRPWKRGRTYATFLLGVHSAGFAALFFVPHAIAFGWIALGLGIPAVILAKREIAQFPQAANTPFIKAGRITGKVGIIAGPIAAVAWIVIFVVMGIKL
jgi:hypothetical protein